MSGCNSRLTGDIFMKPPKATPNKRESQEWWFHQLVEDASGHGSKQRDVLRGNFHLGLIASVGGVHHHHHHQYHQLAPLELHSTIMNIIILSKRIMTIEEFFCTLTIKEMENLTEMQFPHCKRE